MTWRALLTLSMLCWLGCEPSGTPGSGGGAGNGGSGGGGNNSAPVANAGADATVNGDSLVTLDGSASTDPDGDPLTYDWRQISGATVTLMNASSDKPTFVAPGFSGTLTFELTVGDGKANSAPDTVELTVVGYTGGRADVVGFPNDPTGVLNTPNPLDLALAGNVLAVADGDQGVHLVDVSKPPEATILSTFAEPSMDVELGGSKLFTLTTNGDLVVHDAANPAAPIEIARVAGSKYGLNGMSANGTIGAFALGQAGLMLADASKHGFHVVGTIAEPSFVSPQLVGNTLYVNSFGALRIYDVSNPSSPMQLGSFDDGIGASLMRVSGNFAFVRGGNFIRLIDITNPSAPALRGSIPLSTGGIDSDGAMACASMSSDVFVVDIANPDAPAIMGSLSVGDNVESLRMQGNHCYAVVTGKVHVVDMSAPANPSIAATITVPARDVEVAGQWLYVTRHEALEVFDISNIGGIQSVVNLALPGTPTELTLVGNTLYATSDLDGAFVFDVSTPAAPKLLRELIKPRDLDRIHLQGNTLYGAFKDSFIDGLHIYDVTNPAKPTIVGAYRARDTRGVRAAGDGTVYLDRYSLGVTRVDVSDPENPKEVAHRDTWCTESVIEPVGEHVFCGHAAALIDMDFSMMPPKESYFSSELDDAQALQKAGNHLVVGTDSNAPTVTAIDPLDAMAPRVWARPLSERPTSLAVGETAAFVGLYQNGVMISDYAPNLAADPVFTMELDIYPVMDIQADDDRLYVLQWDSLSVFDIKTLPATLLGSVKLDTTSQKMAVENGHVFIAEKTSIIIVDATNAATPTAITFDVGENVQNVAVSGDRMYTVTATGISQYDISNPGTPLLLGKWAQQNVSSELAAQGNTVYALWQQSTRILDFSNAGSPQEVATLMGRWVSVKDGTLACMNNTKLDLYDLQNPLQPMLVGSRDIEGFVPFSTKPYIDGSTIALWSTQDIPTSHVRLIDATSPQTPVAMGRIGFLNGTMQAVTLSKDHVWVTYFGQNGSHVVAYSTMRDSVSLTRSAQGPVKAGENVTFSVGWTDHDKENTERVSCAVSAGSCTVDSVDMANRTAQVSWQVPNAAGGCELAVSVGHQHLDMVGRARITVE